MGPLLRILSHALHFRVVAVEVVGLTLIAIGLEQLYPPAAFIITGAAVVFIAQGMERHE